MLRKSGPGRFIALATISLLIASSSLIAQTGSRTLYMPVLQWTASAESMLTLVNPSLEPANVTLIARSYSGAQQQGAGVINPVSMSLPASSSRALRAKEIFGSAVSAGWVELQTTSSAISGAFFISDPKNVSMDGLELNTAPSNRLIFPKITTDLTASNKLAVINTRSVQLSSITVSLFENSGRPVTQVKFSLPAFGGFSGSISDLVPTVKTFDGYAVVEANSSAGMLIGFETYR